MQRLTMQLNAGFSGPQAWLLLAIRRGYLAEAGIELALTPGNGAWNAAPSMVKGGFDLGYGDVHSLVEVAATHPARAPIGIFAVHNASPSAIAVRRDSPIASARDLPGKRLIGHASDVALRCFGAYAAATGIAPGDVAIEPVEGGMASLVARLGQGEHQRADGLFGYVSTIAAALAAQGRDAAAELHFLRYDAAIPDLHGSLVMASPALVAAEPALLTRLLAALNRGLAEAMADPDSAMEAVMAFAPEANAAAERVRWEVTLAVEMARPPAEGFGGIEDARFVRGLAAFAQGAGLPAPGPIFNPAFLPPPSQRAQRQGTR